MKRQKRLIVFFIVIVVSTAIAFKLTANKRSLDAAQEASTYFNIIVPVWVEPVKKEIILTEFTVNGSFYPWQEASAVSETQGRVTDISIEIGDRVNSGQQLVLVDSKVSMARFKQAKSNLEKAEKDLERYKILIKRDAISTEQYESIEIAYINADTALVMACNQLENSVIRAPINGIITKRNIEKGAFLVPGTSTFDIIDISKVKFISYLTSDQIVRVKRDQVITVTVNSFTNKSYEGIVTNVMVAAGASKRYLVEVEISNQSRELIRPGMFGTAIFSKQSSQKILIVPRKALVGSIKTPEVFIVKENSVALQSIVAEPINDQYLAVRKGLEVGDRVITSGQINLENGSQIKIVN